MNEPLPLSEVVSPQLIEPENPNDAVARNPGDPTVSWNADGTVANLPLDISGTVPVNPDPSPQSDPAHVPSPYQPAEATAEQKETSRLREVALQAENRWRPGETDKTPRVPNPEPAPNPQPVWDPASQSWR